jgi:cytoskeletal protein CcmA (bactofilin family)
MAQPSGTVVRGLNIKGELIAREDLTIDGVFEGTIDIPGYRLTLGKASLVNASVSAAEVSVYGRLDGDVTAEFIELLPGARVSAQLLTMQCALEDGA